MANRIGEILIQIGAMKHYQVEDVLLAQRNGDRRMFGEIAVEFGYINDDAIKRYLDYKEKETQKKI